MSAQSVTLRGRVAAEALMVDACTITRATGGRAFNTTLGAYSARTTGTIYTGACQVQIAGNADALTPDVAGADVTVQQLVVKVPVTAQGHRVQDLVTITASTLDASLVGRTYRVTALHGKSFATARRLQCEEITDA